MRLSKLGSITLGAMLSLAMVYGANAANNTGAVLLRPKQKEKVENLTEVTGKVLMAGYPVVLVRANQPEGLWWAQEWAEGTSPGHFKAKVRIGNDKTPNGTHFQIIVLMVPQVEDSKVFEPGASFKELPANLRRSAETTVVLDKPEDLSAASLDLIQQPRANRQVDQVDSVSCLKLDDRKPVILVRSAESNEAWWVQSEAVADEGGKFISTARFGNAKTPAGARFRIVAIFPDAEEATKLPAGTSLKELPADIPSSAEVEVVRGSGSEISRPVANPAAE